MIRPIFHFMSKKQEKFDVAVIRRKETLLLGIIIFAWHFTYFPITLFVPSFITSVQIEIVLPQDAYIS